MFFSKVLLPLDALQALTRPAHGPACSITITMRAAGHDLTTTTNNKCTCNHLNDMKEISHCVP